MGLKGVWDVGKRGSRLCYQNNPLKIYSIIKKKFKTFQEKKPVTYRYINIQSSFLNE